MRKLFPIILLTAGAVFFASGCKEKEAPKAALPEVIVQTAMPADFREFIPSISNIQAYDSVDLVARVEGFLQKCSFKEGQNVKKGELLFEIEPDKYEAAVKIAEAVLMKAKAEQRNSSEDHKRQKTLIEKQATAERTYENAEAKKMVADAEVLEAEAQLKQAKLNLSYTKIHAPFDGRISFKSYSEGNLVGPASQKLATVLRSGPVKVDFRFNELDMLRMLEDISSESDNEAIKKVKVELFLQNGKKYKHDGKIESYDNRVNESTGTFKIRAVFNNPDAELVPGMYVKVRVHVAKAEKTLAIPPEALQSDMSGDYVFVVGTDHVVTRRNVKNHRQDRVVYVTSGLKANENVIVEGLTKVRQGVKVMPKVQKSSSGAVK